MYSQELSSDSNAQICSEQLPQVSNASALLVILMNWGTSVTEQQLVKRAQIRL